MTGPELIERAARAIETELVCGENWQTGPHDFAAMARAALAALLAATREPSETTMAAGQYHTGAAGHPDRVWRAMHDALARELGVGE